MSCFKAAHTDVRGIGVQTQASIWAWMSEQAGIGQSILSHLKGIDQSLNAGRRGLPVADTIINHPTFTLAAA